jgi:OOP family OmpA-OmpF porin
MKKTISIPLMTGLMCSGFITQHALADAYIGGQVGYSSLSDACYERADCDDESIAGGAFLGYQGTEQLAIELGLDWLGEHKVNYLDGTVKSSKEHLTALTLMPKFSVPFTEKLDVFLKIGVGYMQFGDEEDIVPTLALGGDYQLSDKWDLRLAYQRYQSMDDDIFNGMDTDAIFAGLRFNFGQNKTESMPEVVAEPEPMPEPMAAEPEPTPAPMAEPEPMPAPEPVVAEPEPVTAPEWVTKEQGTMYDESLFEVGSAELSTQGRKALEQLRDTLYLYPVATATIVGHTDSLGSESFNQSLSEQRAQAVADYLIEGGIEEDRLTVKGMGESQPIASNDTAEGRAKNRRVEVEIPEFTYKAPK